jgi:asparagine synthase (glutamine-hydrolysing)
MRRLSILDLAHGHQPMPNDDRTIWIVFNGEIFNAPEIRIWLEKRGHRFSTSNSDTEVLIHLYEEKGPALLEDLNGMFAFVLHDQKRNRLFGARDRMGIKPLYWHKSNGRIAFASELKSLLTLPFIEREIDHQSLFHYMTLLHVPDEASAIKNVNRLPPAHQFTYDLGTQEFTVEKYWQLRFQPDNHLSVDDWASILRSELKGAVKRWSLSDVPIACSLSGGVDSSAVVGLLAELGYSGLKTYSVGFAGEDEQPWNEIDLARQVATRWGTDHHEIILESRELLSDLVRMVWHLDEPYGGGLPSWYVFREMSKDVKVGLTGTGGDELFGNYGKYRIYENERTVASAMALRQWSKSSSDLLASLSAPMANLANHFPSSWRWIGKGNLVSSLPQVLGAPFGHYYYANSEYFSDDFKREHVLQKQNGNVRDTSAFLQSIFDASKAHDVRDGLAAVDFRTQLAEEFLFMTDRFSMAHSLEARVPLLDHTLVETAFRIPPSQRSDPADLKYLFKRAVADLLPEDVLKGRKRGFLVPITLWLRRELRPLVETLLKPERLRQQGLFQEEFYIHFVRPHLDGQADFTWQVWPAFMFQLWHLLFIEQKQVEAPGYDWKAIC